MTKLDLRGKPCPIPVIEVKKQLAASSVGTVLTVLVDNDVARQNLQKLASGLGHAFSHEELDNGDIKITVTCSDVCAPLVDSPQKSDGLVVAIGSDAMGRGDDELGRTLMKSFIFSLSELTPAPEQILFFNGGVHLACEGSGALADLRELSEKGVMINSCGACLSFYGKTDLVRVGGITNMAVILETMTKAVRLINL